MTAGPLGKILVIRGGAIGDFILTLPVFAALRKFLPGNQIEALAYPRVAELALAGGLVDRVRPIEERGFASFFARGIELPREQADYFGGFAVIVSFLYDPDGIFQENVARCSSAQFLDGPHRPDESTPVHAADALLKPLERLAIFDADSTPRLTLVGQASRLPAEEMVANTPTDASLTNAAPVPSEGRRDACPTIALHLGSGSEKKNWPEKNWATLIVRLLERGDVNLLLIGGEAERDRLQRIAPKHSPRLQFAQNLPLTELAARLTSAAAFVGHDSGITHLAAALGLCGLALWGESSDVIWRPRSERIDVVKTPGGLAALRVETVIEKLSRHL